MDDEIQGKTKDGWELASSVPGGERGLCGLCGLPSFNNNLQCS